MASDKIIRYDEEFIGKVEKLQDFLDIGEKDYPVMHSYLMDNLLNITMLPFPQISIDSSSAL